jgi:hypothetical protein
MDRLYGLYRSGVSASSTNIGGGLVEVGQDVRRVQIGWAESTTSAAFWRPAAARTR